MVFDYYFSEEKKNHNFIFSAAFAKSFEFFVKPAFF